MKKLWFTVPLLCGALLGGTTLDDCRNLSRHGKVAQAKSCFATLSESGDPFTRAQALFGLHRFDEANDEFRLALKQQPNSAAVHYGWGEVYLHHYQPGDAAKLFEEALELDPKYAPAYVGLARVAAEGYEKKAVEFAQQALEQDPKLVEAHEVLAYLALEDDNRKLAGEEAQKALALSGEALEALSVLASMDWLDGQAKSKWAEKAVAINPAYGELYATGAHFLVINRRYEEGVKSYRKALELNPELWDARSQLGINLMRLGNTGEAAQQLERCFNAHWRDAQTVNGLRLLDTLKDYETFKTGTTELMLNKKEAALLRPYIEPELQKAIATYQRKYKMTLSTPVRLEVFPNHQDFIVRTLGLPGGGGLLGVTFGTVVAMDSPSARPPGDFNWASTMWHELSHVYVVTATNQLVPRWFTEGLSVHEETAASPDWGDRMSPEIVLALKNKKLLPVLELDRGFVRPEYPTQVVVSYFEAGKICDYIAQKWGEAAILGMIHSYAARKTTADAIQDNLHESAAAFDKEFTAWLDKETAAPVQHFDQWKQTLRAAWKDEQSGNKDGALKQALAIRDQYPEYIGPDSAYELLSTAYLAKGDKNAAILQLQKYRDQGGTNVNSLKKLAELQHDCGNAAEAAKTLRKINYVYPEDEEVHRRLGHLLLDTHDAQGSVREFEVALTLKPADTAQAHYDLAKALSAAHRTNEARDQVLMALEAAPEFKPAQQLLLQLNPNE